MGILCLKSMAKTVWPRTRRRSIPNPSAGIQRRFSTKRRWLAMDAPASPITADPPNENKLPDCR